MKKNKGLDMYFMMLVSFFLLTSCNSQKRKTNNYESFVLYHDGNKMLIENHKDSINVEHVTVYDSDEEKILKRFKLVDSLKNSLEQGYFKSGNIKYKSYYLNDTLQGESIWYYDLSNEKIKNIYNYESGRIVGNHKSFDENGNLKRYFSTTFNEEVVFDIQYDENNKEKPNSLKSKYKIMGAFNHTNFKKNDTIKYDAYFSTPENVKIKYFYSLTPIEQGKYELKSVELNNSKINIDTLIKNEGIYILNEKIEINDISLDTVFFEKYSFKINVQ